jgi:hypothetical protein
MASAAAALPALSSGLGRFVRACPRSAGGAALTASAVALAISRALAMPCGKAPLPRTPLPRATALPWAEPATLTGILGSLPPTRPAPRTPLLMPVPGGRHVGRRPGDGALSLLLARSRAARGLEPPSLPGGALSRLSSLSASSSCSAQASAACARWAFACRTSDALPARPDALLLLTLRPANQEAAACLLLTRAQSLW